MVVVALVAVIGTVVWAGCAGLAQRLPAPSPPSRSAFWPVVAVLLVGGFVTAASVGLPFLLIGVLLMLVAPLRHSAVPLGSVAAGLTIGVITAVLIVPAQCSSTSEAPGVVECSSIAPFGFTTDGADWRVDVASVVIAMAAGAAAAVAAHRLRSRGSAAPTVVA